MLVGVQVMSCKALGIAIKLTLQGDNQLFHPATSVFAAVVTCCVLTQISYLNRVSNSPCNQCQFHPCVLLQQCSFTLVCLLAMHSLMFAPRKKVDCQTTVRPSHVVCCLEKGGAIRRQSRNCFDLILF